MIITSKLISQNGDTVPRALCISIYPKMTESMIDISDQLGVPVDIYEGGIFNDGHLVAQEMQEQYDAIISQAGTAVSIQPLVRVPLVTINITALDFIQAFKKARQYDRKLILISYKSPLVNELNAMAHVFVPDHFCIITYANKEEFQRVVDKVLSMNDHVVMGFGGCIQDMAQANGLPYILVRSREENIRHAVISAKNIIEQNVREKRHARRLQNLVNYSREGIVSINEEHVVTICNRVAKRLLKLKGSKILGSNTTQPDFPASLHKLYGDGKIMLNSLQQIDGTSYIVSRIPVIVRARLLETIITFQQLSQIQKVEARARAQLHHKGLVARYSFDDFLHQHENMCKLVNDAKRYAATQAAVLIEGETGTGKELMAQSIHSASSRRKGPFVAINCAALPEHLLESELFGYEEGAFTGAKRGGRPGVFELAHNGTIFLDEIGELPLSMQGRLLRVLQEKEVFRLGGERIIGVNVRVVSASNRNLYKLVEEGSFRRDLFFRLNLLPLFIPPLRERLADLPLLVRHFMERNARLHGTTPPLLAESSITKMQAYRWPGNVRELQNIIERLCIVHEALTDVDALLCRLLDDHISMRRRSMTLHQATDGEPIAVTPGTMKEMENTLLRAMLERAEGSPTLLADMLGISRVTVWKKLKSLS